MIIYKKEGYMFDEELMSDLIKYLAFSASITSIIESHLYKVEKKLDNQIQILDNYIKEIKDFKNA